MKTADVFASAKSVTFKVPQPSQFNRAVGTCWRIVEVDLGSGEVTFERVPEPPLERQSWWRRWFGGAK